MKIMHLATVASSHRYLLLPQLRALAEAGHDVVAVSADGADVAELRASGIRHRALDGSTRGFDLRADLRAARSFARIVRDERPDLVHTHNPKPGVYGRIVARLLGVPAVVNTVHGLYATPDDGLRRRLAVYGLEALASRFSQLELVQNIEDVELMLRSPLAPSRIVRHLGNGIDLARFGPRDPGTRSRIRSEIGIADDAVAIVAIGRLVAEKGFGELFEASATMTRAHDLVVVGPDDREKADALPATVIDRARAAGVHLLGHRSDIAELLAAMDIFVLPSYREGQPRAAMEAAASGLPIVATDIRGCRQVVDPGETGLLVPRRGVRPLAAALDQLVGDPALRRRFGAAGRAKAEAEFDEQELIRRVLDGYRHVAAGVVDPVPTPAAPAGSLPDLPADAGIGSDAEPDQPLRSS